MNDNQHTLQQNEDSYTCSRCCQTWKEPPSGKCPVVKVYSYTAIPWEQLATYTQLKRQKLKPANVAEPDGCYFRLRDQEYVYLYRIDQAQPRRVPTGKQRIAIEKMRAGLKKAHTCERCGWYDDSHGQLRRQYDRGVFTLKVVEEGAEQERRYCSECRDYLIWVYDRHVIEHNMAVWLSESENRDAPPFLVLDTESTGLPDQSGFQVVEIAVVDRAGAVVFHSLIKPDISVPEAASQVHGLTDADLKDAPGFPELWPRLSDLLCQYEVWCYNAAFDQAAIIATAERFHLDIPAQVQQSRRWHCLMLEFARYYGEYSSYWGNDKWQPLSTACAELGVQSTDYHRARGDALSTLAVMRALAERGGTYPAPEERPLYQSSYYGGDY